MAPAIGMPFPSVVHGLRAEEIDLFIHDAPTAWRIAEERDGILLGLYTPLTEESLAWAGRKLGSSPDHFAREEDWV